MEIQLHGMKKLEMDAYGHGDGLKRPLWIGFSNRWSLRPDQVDMVLAGREDAVEEEGEDTQKLQNTRHETGNGDGNERHGICVSREAW